MGSSTKQIGAHHPPFTTRFALNSSLERIILGGKCVLYGCLPDHSQQWTLTPIPPPNPLWWRWWKASFSQWPIRARNYPFLAKHIYSMWTLTIRSIESPVSYRFPFTPGLVPKCNSNAPDALPAKCHRELAAVSVHSISFCWVLSSPISTSVHFRRFGASKVSVKQRHINIVLNLMILSKNVSTQNTQYNIKAIEFQTFFICH